MRPSIEAKVDELINDMMKEGVPIDLQEHFSLPIAFKVIYEILGIPFEVSHLYTVGNLWKCQSVSLTVCFCPGVLFCFQVPSTLVAAQRALTDSQSIHRLSKH
jgi:hypothetical protein